MIVAVLGTILLLVAITTLYVAAEFAVVSVRRSRVQQKAEEGDRLATRLLPYLKDAQSLDRYVATCQIGITLSSLVLGAYGQAALAPRLTPLLSGLGGMQEATAQSTAAIVVLAVLTIVHMILGELVPKSLALQFPTQLALLTVLPMQVSMRSLSWFIKVLNGSGLWILRLLGVREAGHHAIHSPDEIEYLMAESREGGLLAADEHVRLRKALRLGVTSVEEVMVPRTRIRAIRADTTPEQVLKIALESPYTRLPVYEETIDQVAGYVHVQDMVRLEKGTKLPLRPVLFVPAGLSVDRVLDRLRTERQHMALVSDEYGGTAGLVTVGDILDEILGGVADEFKPAEAGPEKLPDGRLRLPGSMRRDEAAMWVGAEWEGESATVAGLVMEHLGRLPHAGEKVLIEHVPVEVEAMNGRMVTSVLAGPLELERKDEDDE
jgi:CBS domain containing-hemolysin-like protein